MTDRTHDLKTWPTFFVEVLSGHKTFEVRRNDRDYRAGDLLRLREWSPDTQTYTGRETVRRVTYALDSSRHEGVAPGHVVMGIAPVAEPPADGDLDTINRAMLANAKVTRPADGDLERKVRAALTAALYRRPFGVDTAVAELSPVVVRLIEEERAGLESDLRVARAGEALGLDSTNRQRRRAEKAEAAVSRVRALCEHVGLGTVWTDKVLEALDGTETTR